MTGTVRRIVSCFVFTVAVAGLAAPGSAQVRSGQQRAVEGSHVWGEDGWCYVIQNGRLVRTAYFRVFPDPRNRTVFHLFENGRFVRPVTVSPVPGGGSRQPGNSDADLERLIKQLNQLTAAAPRPAPQRPGTRAFCPPVQGPFIAPNVRVNVPMYGCETPEELAHQRRGIATRQNEQAMAQMRACYRAEQPYRAPLVQNGEVLYRLDDGSVHRRGGSLNPGWMWGPNGMPQRKEACF